MAIQAVPGTLDPQGRGDRQPGRRSRRTVLAALRGDPGAVVGAAIVAIFAALAVAGPLLEPHGPNGVDVARTLASPSARFPLGTDYLGRDELARLVYAARISIGSAVAASAAIAVVGVSVGLVAGFVGGIVDTLLSAVIDVLLAFPTFLLALAVTGVLGPGLLKVLVAVVIVWWAGYARIVRSAVLAEREKLYIQASRGFGASTWRVLTRHLLRNIVAPIVVLTTLDMGMVLLGIAGLSFLGLGPGSTTPEWGAMLAEAKNYVQVAPLLSVYPGAAIFVMVLGFNLLGDGLRDALDPRLSQWELSASMGGGRLRGSGGQR